MRFTCYILFFLTVFSLWTCNKSKQYAVTTGSAEQIKATSMTVSGTAKGSDSKIVEVGFCFSDNKVPVYGDDHIVVSRSFNDSFKGTVKTLKANTSYNIRAFSKLQNGDIYYGNILTVSTNGIYDIGDIGPGGGVIFFTDEYSAAGKYFEAKPILGNTFMFGCDSVFLNNGSYYGEGQGNTTKIINSCGNNTAAYACKHFGANGLSDWCLPTIQDLENLKNFYNDNNNAFSDRTFWSSSDFDSRNAYAYNFLMGEYDVLDKSEKHEVIAVRYFN